MTKKEETTALGVGLAASILGSLALVAANSDLKTKSRQLRQSQDALNGILQDWQAAYVNVRGQLAGAQRLTRELTKQNQELASEVEALRTERDGLRQTAYDEKQRRVELEATLGAERLARGKTRKGRGAAPEAVRKAIRQTPKRRKKGGEAAA